MDTNISPVGPSPSLLSSPAKARTYRLSKLTNRLASKNTMAPMCHAACPGARACLGRYGHTVPRYSRYKEVAKPSKQVGVQVAGCRLQFRSGMAPTNGNGPRTKSLLLPCNITTDDIFLSSTSGASVKTRIAVQFPRWRGKEVASVV